MRQAIERMKAAKLGKDDPLDSDIAFHVAVLKGTGNRFFGQLEELIDTALRISIQLTNRTKGVAQADVIAHEKVLDAIASRNAERARVLMENILSEVMELIAEAKALPELPRAAERKKNIVKARR
jgi:DNA-binding FadR family transcriptional regulator